MEPAGPVELLISPFEAVTRIVVTTTEGEDEELEDEEEEDEEDEEEVEEVEDVLELLEVVDEQLVDRTVDTGVEVTLADVKTFVKVFVAPLLFRAG